MRNVTPLNETEPLDETEVERTMFALKSALASAEADPGEAERLQRLVEDTNAQLRDSPETALGFLPSSDATGAAGVERFLLSEPVPGIQADLRPEASGQGAKVAGVPSRHVAYGAERRVGSEVDLSEVGQQEEHWGVDREDRYGKAQMIVLRAQVEADAVRGEARLDASRMVNDADMRAREMRWQAEVDIANREADLVRERANSDAAMIRRVAELDARDVRRQARPRFLASWFAPVLLLVAACSSVLVQVRQPAALWFVLPLTGACAFYVVVVGLCTLMATWTALHSRSDSVSHRALQALRLLLPGMQLPRAHRDFDRSISRQPDPQESDEDDIELEALPM
jgi:hypothetical protein